jgi:LPS-assembly protein
VIIQSDRINKSDSDIIATGNVEISKDDYTIKSDRIIYNVDTKEIVADNEIRIYDKKGKKFYIAEKASLKSDMSASVFYNGSVVLDDGTALRSPYISKNDNQYILKPATYSVCPVKGLIDNYTKENENNVAEITGSTIEVDMDKRKITVWNGIFWYHNVPMFYVPYINANIGGKSTGFDTPAIIYNNNYGYSISVPYKIGSENYKLTFKPSIFLFEYKKNETVNSRKNYYLTTIFENKYINIVGDIANDNYRSQNFKISQTKTEKDDNYKKIRGYFKTNADFNIDDNWNFNYETLYVSDEYYMRDYYHETISYTKSYFNLNWTDTDFENYDYFSFNNLFFQEFNKRAISDYNTPKYIPTIDYNLETKYTKFYIDTVNLIRSDQSTYNRVSFIPSLKYNLDSIYGFTKINLNLISTSYIIANKNYNSVVPQIDLEWSKSLIFEDFLFKPIVKYIYNPEAESIVVNEDSEAISLNYINIFSNNKFIGYDVLEYGQRVVYGLEGVYGDFSLGLAQGYASKIEEQKIKINGFGENLSDFVGYFSFFHRGVSIYSNFVLDKNDYFLKKNETIFSANYNNIFNVNVSYIRLLDDFKNEKENQLNLSAGLKITKNIKISGGFTEELKKRKLVRSNINLTYNDGCVIWVVEYENRNPIDGINKSNSVSVSYNLIFF